MQKVLIALFATGAAALAPAPATGVAANRRAALQKVAGAIAGALARPQVASADGAVSTATVARSRGIYGGRIAALSGAVSKGDFAAVADEKNAFILFNSGAYQLKTPAAKAAKAVAQEGTANIFAAVVWDLKLHPRSPSIHAYVACQPPLNASLRLPKTKT